VSMAGQGLLLSERVSVGRGGQVIRLTGVWPVINCQRILRNVRRQEKDA
jgi:hypothetical protein